MTQHTIPAGIVRSISIVKAGDDYCDGVTVIYVDGVRKFAAPTGDSTMFDLADLIVRENCNGKVLHFVQYTANDFLEEVCLDDTDRFLDLVPELLQHLKVDQD